MRTLLGLGIGLLLAGCSSDTIIYAGGDAGPGADSSSPGDDGSPTDDSAAPDSGPADSGPPDRSKCTTNPDKTGTTTRTYAGAPDYTVYVPKTYDMNVPSALIEILHGAG